MGCDIHGRLEVRYDNSGDYYKVGPVEDSRNYAVFAMLAGVRNRYDLEPISAPRGLPADLRGEEDWEFGDHSHSWVTLREVLDWPGWAKPLGMSGILDREEYEHIQRDGSKPRSWCQGVSGSRIIVADSLTPDCTHVRHAWEETFADYAPVFRRWLDYLEVKHGWMLRDDPAAVRLVFGFDS